MKLKIRIQHDEMDCGAACIAMIADYYGQQQPIRYYRQLCQTDRNGTTLEGLADCCRHIGLRAEGYQANTSELISAAAGKSLSLPLIVHVLTDQHLYHYMILYRIRGSILYMADPAFGYTRMTCDTFSAIWTGFFLEAKPGSDFRKTKNIRQPLQFIRQMIHSEIPALGVVLLLSFVITGIGLLTGLACQSIIDGRFQSYNRLLGGLLFIYAGQGLLLLLRGHLLTCISYRTDMRIAGYYFKHLIHMQPQDIQARSTGDYVSRFNETAGIRSALSGTAVSVLLNIGTAMISGYLLFNMNKLLFMTACMILFLYGAVSLICHPGIHLIKRTVMTQNAALQSFIQEHIDGIRIVKEAAAEPAVLRRFFSHMRQFEQAVHRSLLLQVRQGTAIQMICAAGRLILLWIGFSLIHRGRLSAGTLVSFYMILDYFIEPVQDLIELQPELQAAWIAADRLTDVTDTPAAPAASRNGSSRPGHGRSAMKEIREWRADDMGFAYTKDQPVISHLSFTLKKGEQLAVYGPSGSGKSTLTGLLMGFYTPTCGQLLADRRPLAAYSLRSLRAAIACVNQDPVLFTGSIEENLLFGLTDPASVPMADLHSICQICCIHDFILSLPLGYQTHIRGNGSELSGGQRQRLCLARALLRRPQLLLLDEALCHLDEPMRLQILANLKESIGPSTAILIISHDPLPGIPFIRLT